MSPSRAFVSGVCLPGNHDIIECTSDMSSLSRIWQAVLLAPVATLHSRQGRVGCLYRKLRRLPRSSLGRRVFSAERERTCLQRAPLWTRNQLTQCKLGVLCVLLRPPRQQAGDLCTNSSPSTALQTRELPIPTPCCRLVEAACCWGRWAARG